MNIPQRLVFNKNLQYVRLDVLFDWLDKQEDYCLEKHEKYNDNENLKALFAGRVVQIDCMRIMLNTL